MLALKTKKIALIGYGSISKAYLDVLGDVPDTALVSIVEPNINQMREFKNNQVKHYLTVAEMIAHEPKPDMAIVCSPPNTHRNVLEQLLKARVPTLVEKPISLTPEDSDRISALAIKNNVKISTAAKFRFTAGLQIMKTMIQEGQIGELEEVFCTFTGPLDANSNWRGNPEIAGGGVWMDNGPHALDVVEMLAGFIRKIRITKCAFEQNAPVEDEVEVECLHDNDVKSFILLSWNRQIKAPYATCVGTQGELKAEWNETLLVKGGATQKISNGYDKHNAFKSLLLHFLNNNSNVPDHGSEALKWIQAGYRSLQTGEWETIP